jgi:small-conductance mechanosensitive channel/CRP-like cAMP-binding protein
MNVTLLPAAILFVIAIVGVFTLRRFSDRVRISFDAICFIAISLYLAKQGTFPVFSPLNGSADSSALWLRAIGGAWWLLASRIVVASLGFVIHRGRRSREARLFSDLSAAAIYIATAAVVLNSVFALPVTGVVATSGVVAIVLGLALQNTLADVFAGIAVGVEAPFGVGDRIVIADRIEGLVVQMNWRSIRIQTDGHDIAIIPNSLIAKAEIINRSFPGERRSAFLELSCPENAAPDRVIEALQQATLLCPDIVRTPEPRVALWQLGPKRNAYKISFSVESTAQLSSTKDLLLRGAQRQLHYAGLLDWHRKSQMASPIVNGDALSAHRLLRGIALFEHLAERQIEGLADLLQTRRLEPRDILFSEGVSDTALYIVASGIVELTRKAGATLQTLGCIGAGEYVGEIGLLTDAPHAATAVARTHCNIHLLPREAIAPLLSESVELASAFDKAVRRGLDILHREVAARATPGIGAKGQLLLRIRRAFHFCPE